MVTASLKRIVSQFDIIHRDNADNGSSQMFLHLSFLRQYIYRWTRLIILRRTIYNMTENAWFLKHFSNNVW